VLNHHRIGEPTETAYDQDVFSATQDELDQQLRLLKKTCDTVTLDDAISIVEGRTKLRRTAVLVTFDDGYLDNYELAFPVMAANQVQGVFFLPTAFIGTNRIAWWDSVSYIIRRSRKSTIHFRGRPYSLSPDSMIFVIREVQQWYKDVLLSNAAPTRQVSTKASIAQGRSVTTYAGNSDSDLSEESFLSELENACEAERPPTSARCFMNWDEATTMVRGGMAVGSHTHNHELLASISDERQYHELSESKTILENRLPVRVNSIAYPNGLQADFSSVTREAATKLGYRIGFSFYGGTNLQPVSDPFDVRRVPVRFNTPPERFEFQVALASLTAGYWF
jgi:peptidoglycan/xylan/chitin deacetylase (PgdA/CDA1 family)